jgi:drug/metabolite transporter (DMT)-like permease
LTSSRYTGVLLVVVSAASFGALGVLARVAYDDGASPIGVLLWRFTIVGLVVMGAGYMLQSICYFTAIDHAPPGLVALLLYTFPAMVVAGGVVLFGERLTRSLVVACGVAIAGTALIVGPTASGAEPVGIAFGLGAAVVYSGYILVGSRVLRHTDPLSASTVIMTTAALGFDIVFVASPHRPAVPETASGWRAIALIAVLCTVLAALAFLAGLARVGPAAASTLSTVEPVVSVALSAIIIGEDITAWTLIGGTMVIASVIALSRATAVPLVEPAPAA